VAGGHLGVQVFVVPTHFAEGRFEVGYGLVLHLGEEGLEGALGAVDFEPIGRILPDPMAGVMVDLWEERPHPDDLLAELGHAAGGFPLGEAFEVAVDPEAAAAGGDDRQRLGVVGVGDELGAMGEQGALFEAEGIDGPEGSGREPGGGQAELVFQTVGEVDVGVGVLVAQGRREGCGSVAARPGLPGSAPGRGGTAAGSSDRRGIR
jgi:hypothetical protein